ncbi:MAG: glycoside hydrolase 43 family protein [Prevotellaceae bacterium]|jgi:beta-xylosidase|nr:glycoside hydrolase 43 family protein [Prevotellaceae bacterium]
MLRKLFLPILFISTITFAQTPYLSKVWQADQGNGTYKNPVLYADYSDPDVCRAGKDFYMTASSFNCVPGLPVLHSRDLVNWQLIGHALKRLSPEATFARPQHGNGVWAPAIRYHKGEFYIFWGDPDFGFYMTKTTDPAGDWSEPVLLKEGKGLIDCCPFWDNNGKAYLVHALAGSRAGYKSVLCLAPMSPDGTRLLGESRIVFDGHEKHPTVEGAKLYKRNGYYYLFAPAGGVATGWQLVLRSKNIWGPYDEKIVLAQGNTSVNGPHQGAWVDTPAGEDWFLHFQDADAYGRIVHLQPMVWKNDFPVIGADPDDDGCGEPVMKHRKPNVGKTYPIQTPPESDEFNSNTLGLQWQWHANPNFAWSFCDAKNGKLRLYSVFTDSVKNLWDVPNLLLQKFPAPEFTATAKVSFLYPQQPGERFSFVVMGEDYAAISLYSGDGNEENGRAESGIWQIECRKANKGTAETINDANKAIVDAGKIIFTDEDNYIYLRIEVKEGGKCKFSYSFDNEKYASIGNEFTAKPGRWIGAKIGFVYQRPKPSNDGGWVDIDWIRFE